MDKATKFLTTHFPEWGKVRQRNNQVKINTPGNREPQAVYYRDKALEQLGPGYDITIINDDDGFSTIFIEKLELVS